MMPCLLDKVHAGIFTNIILLSLMGLYISIFALYLKYCEMKLSSSLLNRSAAMVQSKKVTSKSIC